MKFEMRSTLVGAFVLALVLASMPVESRAAEQTSAQISRKEAKQLMRNASSAEDYKKLFAYFEARAQSLEANAREHEMEADHYASTPGIQPKVPYAGGFIAHCRFLASEYRLEAQQARTKAHHYKALLEGTGRA